MKQRQIRGISKSRPKTVPAITLGPAGSRFDRITFEPGKMGGRACIRGMRVTVGMIISLVADGVAHEEILKDYPYLEAEDIRQALGYAAWLTREEVIPA